MSPSTETPLEQLSEHASTGSASILLAAPQAVAFWAAIAIPLTYAPLLFNGLQGSEGTLFLVLLLANFVAFVLGHGHLADADARVDPAQH